VRKRAPDRGMQVLELKLSILAQGPSRTRRNPALDILTGRVPDDRLLSLSASLMATRTVSEPESLLSAVPAPIATTGPTSMVLPLAAIRMAAVARSPRRAPSPWLQATADARPRLRLISPPPSRWSRVPWLGPMLTWLRVESRPYRWTARSPRAHPAS
jgi:hypothetical protein